MVNTLYNRTIKNGGGTFTPVTYTDVTYGYAVGLVDGTYRQVNSNDKVAFNDAIASLEFEYPYAAIGTWLDGDTIHIDPTEVLLDEDIARSIAYNRGQLAYYVLHEQREVRI